MNRVRDRHPYYFQGRKVLEVGSLDINGSVRPFFSRCDYTGVDLGTGPGVDRVCHAADLPREFARFEVVVSCEALEHDRRWYDTLAAIQRLLVPGGILIVTCAGPGREEHGTAQHGPECSPYTPDYYRNLSRDDLEPLLFWPAFWSCTTEDTRFYMIAGMM
jgi:hypothetical protein